MAANLRQKIGELIGGNGTDSGAADQRVRADEGFLDGGLSLLGSGAAGEGARLGDQRAAAQAARVEGGGVGAGIAAGMEGGLRGRTAVRPYRRCDGRGRSSGPYRASGRARHAVPLQSDAAITRDTAAKSDAAITALNAWWAASHADILRGYEEALNLGDCYLVINGDLSVTVVPPHVVEPMIDGDGRGGRVADHERHGSPLSPLSIAWRGGTTGAPYRVDGSVTVVDEYTMARRVRRIERGGGVMQTERFDNLIGRDPGDPHRQPHGRGRVLRQTGRRRADPGAATLWRRDRRGDTREYPAGSPDAGDREDGDGGAGAQVLGEVRAARDAYACRTDRARRWT